MFTVRSLPGCYKQDRIVLSQLIGEQSVRELLEISRCELLL
jgi:hypothetical protein